MTRISVRVNPDLHDRLHLRAAGAQLPFSDFVRSALHQAADPAGRYTYSSQDEILATCIQVFAILATSVGDRTPDTLARGMEHARSLLGQRGLLDREQLP